MFCDGEGGGGVRKNIVGYSLYSEVDVEFSGQLHHGFRRPGGQYKRYKDCLKSTMTQCGITPSELETLAMDRAGWHFTCKLAVEEFEVRRI